MLENQCSCAISSRRPNDEICLKCGSVIDEKYLKNAVVVDFPSDFTSNPCSCNENIQTSWGSRKIVDVNVCNFCNLFLRGDVETDFSYFSETDLPKLNDPSMPQYKVITQKDRFFSSKFNPAVIEKALNEYAQHGWVLKQAVTADFGSVGMSRNELILFMEKISNVENNH